MIAVDASAIVAILLDEPEAAYFVRAIARSDRAIVGAPTLLEASIVLRRAVGPAADERLGLFLKASGLEVRSFDIEHVELAQRAYRRFGKGTGHQAQLNFGDCMSYAIARLDGAPLLFKGDDFEKTDLTPVSPP